MSNSEATPEVTEELLWQAFDYERVCLLPVMVNEFMDDCPRLRATFPRSVGVYKDGYDAELFSDGDRAYRLADLHRNFPNPVYVVDTSDPTEDQSTHYEIVCQRTSRSRAVDQPIHVMGAQVTRIDSRPLHPFEIVTGLSYDIYRDDGVPFVHRTASVTTNLTPFGQQLRADYEMRLSRLRLDAEIETLLNEPAEPEHELSDIPPHLIPPLSAVDPREVVIRREADPQPLRVERRLGIGIVKATEVAELIHLIHRSVQRSLYES